jgi:hypothetical protein
LLIFLELTVFPRREHQLLRISDIARKRWFREERGRNFALISKDPNVADFVVSLDWVLPFDPAFRSWINSIPTMRPGTPEIRL